MDTLNARMPRKKHVLKNEEYRVFEVRWSPKDWSLVNKKRVKEIIEEQGHSDNFLRFIKTQDRHLIFRVIAIRHELEKMFSEKFKRGVAFASYKKLVGEGVIQEDAYIRPEDCEINMFYVFTISGDNMRNTLIRVGKTKEETLSLLDFAGKIINIKIEGSPLKGTNRELYRVLGQMKKGPLWKKAPALPKPEPKFQQLGLPF